MTDEQRMARLESRHDQLDRLVEEKLGDLERIANFGPNGSERDDKIVRPMACTLAAKAHMQRAKRNMVQP